MELSERERQICTCIICAAHEASVATGKPGGFRRAPTFGMWLDVEKIRQLRPFFDLFLLVADGNGQAVQRITNSDPDRFISKYRFWYEDRSKGRFQTDEVVRLYYRLKAALKESVAQQKIRPRTLYIADCHFYHNRICQEMDKRGFSGFEEMNEHMIAQWNKKVTAKDDVYILGDFSISRPDATVKILDRLNGKLHLIVGNHDKYLEDKHYSWRSWFRSIEDYAEIRDNGRNVILSHYPVFCYKGQYRRDKDGRPLTYTLYGHVHNTHDEVLINRFIMETRATKVMSRHATEPEPIPCNMINCFCMFSDYQPMTLDEWIVIDRERREKMDKNQKERGSTD